MTHETKIYTLLEADSRGNEHTFCWFDLPEPMTLTEIKERLQTEFDDAGVRLDYFYFDPLAKSVNLWGCKYYLCGSPFFPTGNEDPDEGIEYRNQISFYFNRQYLNRHGKTDDLTKASYAVQAALGF